MHTPIHNLRYFIAAAGLLLVANVSGDPPTWWSEGDPPVIDNSADPNNHGPANIGQAKWMAKSAIEAIRPINLDIASAIELTLVGQDKIIKTLSPPADDSDREKNHAPLLIGQLKAIATPFYDALHDADPVWLETQLTDNETKDAEEITNYYPWTQNPADDQNQAIASIGHLKAVFSLRLETLDLDHDGLPDKWEREFASKLLALGAPQDHWGDNWYSLQSGDLIPSATLQEDGLTIMELYNGSGANDRQLLQHDVFMQAKRAEFRSSAFYQVRSSPEETEPLREGYGEFTNGSPGYGWGTIETWSRSHASSNTFDVSLDPFSISPTPTLDWVKNQNDSLTWTYHTHWDDAFQLNPRTLFPLDQIGSSSVTFMLDQGGASSYFHHEKTWQEGDTSVTRQEWNGDTIKSKFRLYRPRPTGDPLSLYFLKVTTEHSLVDVNPPDSGISLGWSDTPPTITKEVVKVTIPAYGHTSPWIETSPETADLKSRSVELSLIEVTELSPKVKDGEGNDIVNSQRAKILPESNAMVERNPDATPALDDASAIRIAWREVKAKIGREFAGQTVTWSMTPLFTPSEEFWPGPPFAADFRSLRAVSGGPRFRGSWEHAEAAVHKQSFSASECYELPYQHAFATATRNQGTASGTATTTVDVDGYTAIRVNLPPIGFNKARVSITVEGNAIDLLDLEVPAVVVIDPGHGGTLPETEAAKRSAGYLYSKTRGEWTLDGSSTNHAISFGSPTTETDAQKRHKTEERTLTLQLGLLLRNEFTRITLSEKLNGVVVMTRTNDENVGFGDRTEHAWKKGADIFLSIHFNGNILSGPRGSEVWVEPIEVRANGCANTNYAQDASLGTRVLTSMAGAIPSGGRRPADGEPRTKGFEPPDSLSIPTDTYTDRADRLRNIDINPKSRACLAEVEFITNQQVEESLVSGPQSNTNCRTLSTAMVHAVIKDIKIQQP